MNAAEPPFGAYLYPTDFSPASVLAFSYAERLAAQAHAVVVALHVATMPDTWGTTLDGPSHHQQLRHQLNRVTSSRVPVLHILDVGDPGPDICRRANQWECAMIVLGMPPRYGLDRLAFGSIGDYVLRNAACPVAVARQHIVAQRSHPEATTWQPGLQFAE